MFRIIEMVSAQMHPCYFLWNLHLNTFLLLIL
jgi:hypothetical protein